MTYLIRFVSLVVFTSALVCLIVFNPPSLGWFFGIVLISMLVAYGSQALANDLIEVRKRSKYWKHYY